MLKGAGSLCLPPENGGKEFGLFRLASTPFVPVVKLLLFCVVFLRLNPGVKDIPFSVIDHKELIKIPSLGARVDAQLTLFSSREQHPRHLMATSTRQFTLAARRAAASTTRTLSATSRRTLHQSSRRFTSQTPPPLRSSVVTSSSGLWLGAGLAAAGAGWWFGTQGKGSALPAVFEFQPTKEHYQTVYDEIAHMLQDQDEYDDGSYGPVVLRLAWHASGTYDKETDTGGSNGATMRFKPEGEHGANRGLLNARDFLEPVKRKSSEQWESTHPCGNTQADTSSEKFPWITYADLWILAGVCATQEMLGPKVPYRPGRADKDIAACTPDGRLPNGALGQDHIRAIFGRMGFDDREIVALSGAHAVGRCHPQHSGFDGPWTFSPTVITNEYYKLLDGVKWERKTWDGPKQVSSWGEERVCV
jgi:cytochrome c peroxidase